MFPCVGRPGTWQGDQVRCGRLPAELHASNNMAMASTTLQIYVAEQACGMACVWRCTRSLALVGAVLRCAPREPIQMQGCAGAVKRSPRVIPNSRQWRQQMQATLALREACAVQKRVNIRTKHVQLQLLEHTRKTHIIANHAPYRKLSGNSGSSARCLRVLGASHQGRSARLMQNTGSEPGKYLK